MARLTVTLFLLLVGLSLYLSFSRAEQMGRRDRFGEKLVRRSAWILSLALGITMVTYLIIGRGFIVFGVLHLIGLSLLLAYPFLRMGWKNFILGSILIILGLYVQEISVDHYWLPWLGLVLYGVGLGGLVYPGYRRRVSWLDQSTVSGCSWARLLCYLGRNSLAIYLIHQPLIILLLFLTGTQLSFF